MHGRRERAHKPPGEASHGLPLGPSDPHALWIERRQPSDVIDVEMRHHDAVEVSRLVAESSELGDERLLGRDVEGG